MLSIVSKALPVALLAAVSVSGLAQAGNSYAIVGARIEIGNGKSLSSGTVIVQDGKIVQVGENVTVPSGMQTVSAAGMVLYPGFIDAYTTRGLQLPEAPAAATPRDTTNTAPPTMWEANRKGIRSELQAAKCLNYKDSLGGLHGQGLTAALLSPGGGTLRGTAAVVQYTDEEGSARILKEAYGPEMAFRAGAGTGYPGSLMGVIALLRQTLYDAQRYGMLQEKEEDAALAALQPALKGESPVVFAADSAREIERAHNIANEFNLSILIAGGREAYEALDILKSGKTEVLLNISVGDEPEAPSGESSIPAEVFAERKEQWRTRASNAATLHKEGVLFAFSSDGDSQGDYLANVRKLISLGLPKEAALAAMTGNPARILGVQDRLGTIETGKTANLVLMSGDFADEKSTVGTVFVAGKKFDVKKEENR